MTATRRPRRPPTAILLATIAVVAAAGACGPTAVAPDQPTWADAAPVLRGECVGCHGWTAADTGASYRFDLFEAGADVCGDAALALDSGTLLAGSLAAPPLIRRDVGVEPGAHIPRMPPRPAPALPDWERQTLERWGAAPVKGPAPATNHPPAVTVSGFPTTANGQLSFTAILDDADGDGAIGVIEVGQFAFLMNRTGSFDVTLNTSALAPGVAHPTAVVCDGWVSRSIDLGPVLVAH